VETVKHVTPPVEPQAAKAARRFPDQPATILNPTPVEAAARVHDKATMIMDAKWGTDVLLTLVAPDLAAKFTRAACRRDAAIESGTEEEIIEALKNVVRGLKVMDEAAVADGRVPLKIDRSWAARADNGQAFLFVQSEEDTRSAARSGRFEGYQIWSLPEVMRVLQQNSLTAVLAAKAAFPEATVATPTKPPVDWLEGDGLPF
jgi:hypothetical protein